MSGDDDPPSRAAPSSSRSGGPESTGAAYDWPDDETFVGAAPPDPGRPRPVMTARALLDEGGLELNLSLLAGAAGVDRPIAHTRIQKSGLALAGHFHGIVPTRIQILGQTEQSYLDRLEAEARRGALLGFYGLGLSCVILTGDLGLASRELVTCADSTGTPLLHAIERSSTTITALHAMLDERLAPRKRLHGVLIDVFGVGLLIMGPSGVGKSECALDLVMRGHRLVADDVVECDYRPPGMVFGAPAKLLRHHLEVRGLGILNIKDLFGVTAIRERKRIDVVVRLVDDAAKQAELDRLGLEEHFCEVLGVSVPELVIPVRPGRDMASILEVAARNELLKNAGHHAARELFGTIEAQIQGGTLPGPGALETVLGSTPRSPVVASRGALGRGGAARVPPAAPESVFGVPGTRVGSGRAAGPSWPRTDESAAPPPVTAAPRATPPRGVPPRGKGR